MKILKRSTNWSAIIWSATFKHAKQTFQICFPFVGSSVITWGKANTE